MQSENNEYLLDTNCFYSIGRNKSKIDKIRSLASKVTTASVAVAEIQRIEDLQNDTDFRIRQAAMFALDNVTDEIYVTADLTVIPQAFGQPFDKCAKYPRESIKTFLSAKSTVEINELINDNLKAWKADWQPYYSNLYRKVLNYPPDSENKLRTELIISYACHAGLFSKETYSQAKIDKGLFDRISRQALDNYTGQLDVLISFLIKMNQTNYMNKKIDENRLFDLEFFFHMRPDDSNQVFVTKEKDLIEIFEKVNKNRILHFDSLISN